MIGSPTLVKVDRIQVPIIIEGHLNLIEDPSEVGGAIRIEGEATSIEGEAVPIEGVEGIIEEVAETLNVEIIRIEVHWDNVAVGAGVRILDQVDQHIAINSSHRMNHCLTMGLGKLLEFPSRLSQLTYPMLSWEMTRVM